MHLILDIEQSPEIKIKIEICKIFDYLLDWREDFYLDNVIGYFQNVFYKKYSKSDKKKEDIHLSEDIISLMPVD